MQKHFPVWLIVALVILIGAGITFTIIATSPKIVDKSAQPALQQNTLNVARQNDASAIMAAIDTYINANNGDTPQTTGGNGSMELYICGIACDTAKTTVTLHNYKASDVSFQTYEPHLTVPDTDTVYIVNGATCNSANDGIGDQARARQFVILYGLSIHSSTQQKCLSI